MKTHNWLHSIPLYKGGDNHLPGYKEVIKLSSNENAYGCCPEALQVLKACQNSCLSRYPDGSSQSLINTLSETYQIPQEKLFCGSGSGEILYLLALAFAGQGYDILYGQHSFSMYHLAAQRVGANGIAIPDNGLQHDLSAVQLAITEKTRLIYLATPNNPTGLALPWSDLRVFIEKLPKHLLLVIDAAYSEFINDPVYQLDHNFLQNCDNVVVTHTFSKLYGLASLRIGWACAHPSIIEILNRIRLPFNLSWPAQQAAIASVKAQEWVQEMIAMNLQQKQIMQNALKQLEYKYVPSQANFILIDMQTPQKAQQIDIELRKKGIIVRRMDSYNLPHCLRLSLGLPIENQQVLRVLESMQV